MAAQNDIISGFDFSAVSTLTQEQLMQGINQAEPLDNIGFIIVSTTRPDITSNPRFIRFIWLDISTPSNPQIKRYVGDRTVLQDIDASWGTITLEDLAVLTGSFALRSATGGVNVALLKLNADYSPTPASAGYILRVAANGKDIEVVSVSNALGSGGIELDRLTLSGSGTNKYIGINAGILAYKVLSGSDFTSALGNRLPLEGAIQPATARFVARTNAAGDAGEWVTPNGVFNDTELEIRKLTASGQLTNDIVRFSGTLWERVTPGLRVVAGELANAGIASSVVDTITTGFDVAHGITGGVIPRIFRAVLKNISGGVATGTGHAANSEVPIECFLDSAAASEYALTCSVDTTNFTITARRDYSAANNIQGPKVGAPGAMANITKSQWQIKLYAWG